MFTVVGVVVLVFAALVALLGEKKGVIEIKLNLKGSRKALFEFLSDPLNHFKTHPYIKRIAFHEKAEGKLRYTIKELVPIIWKITYPIDTYVNMTIDKASKRITAHVSAPFVNFDWELTFEGNSDPAIVIDRSTLTTHKLFYAFVVKRLRSAHIEMLLAADQVVNGERVLPERELRHWDGNEVKEE
eukprot:GILK01009275.1.p1 GENE.GILK01009275.1~~GILK01009275.1.p1  ORF type:complete len:186 (+),score=26.37 GILK01009275.1:16-573(+)